MKLIKPTHLLFMLVLLLSLILSACGDVSVADAAPVLTDEEANGKRLFSIHCASCHATSGDTVIVGPPLGGIHESGATRMNGVDAAIYIELSILNPGSFLVEGFQDIMPTTFGKQLTTVELNALVAYTLTLAP